MLISPLVFVKVPTDRLTTECWAMQNANPKNPVSLGIIEWNPIQNEYTARFSRTHFFSQRTLLQVAEFCGKLNQQKVANANSAV